jgi:hypothetical protein
MHTVKPQRGYLTHLENASKNVNSWPDWKKELAGVVSVHNKDNPQRNTNSNKDACNTKERQ